jgi:hypothetical protein
VNAPATSPGAERATFDVDAATGARAIDSIVLRGDLSGLGPAERARFYVQMCEGLGLNPHAQPFAFLRLNGKEILYATRGCTDQLAAMHRVTRRIVDGPKLIDLAGTKLIYCVCEASMPNGRVETSCATVPLTDPANVLMKAETKAKRRATLSILGLGVLDEAEVGSIPGARDAGPAPDAELEVDLNADLHEAADTPVALAPAASPAPAPAPADVPERPETSPDVPSDAPAVSPAVAALKARIASVTTPEGAVAWWLAERAALAPLSEAERRAVKRALARRLSEVGPAGVRSLSAAEVHLRSAIDRALREVRTAAEAAALTLPTPPSVVLVPAGPDAGGPDLDPEAVLARFAEAVAEVRLPGEAAALWLAHRAVLGELPRASSEAAFRGLCDHVERVAQMSNVRHWLKRAITEADARRAGDASAPSLAGAA